jgi:hypothetical protein
MKKFDIKEARAGKSVVTRNGKEAKVLYFAREVDRFPIVAIIEKKHVYCYTEEGKFYDDENHKESKNDLFMA